MKLSYHNQRILVTGASAGIGREMARLLAERGARHLILVARRAAQLEALAAELSARHPELTVSAIPCDLSDTAAIDDLLLEVARRCGAVDILINNAGLGDYSLFEAEDWQRVQQMLRLNIEGLTYLSHRLVNPMIALGRGGILNISSGLGLLVFPGKTVYSATKHYVTAFTEGLRAELRGTGVLVGQACPGPVATEFARVAGSERLGQGMPSLIRLEAAPAAAEILDGFARGKALVIPGRATRALTRLGSLLPLPLRRLAYGKARQRMLSEAGLAQGGHTVQPGGLSMPSPPVAGL